MGENGAVFWRKWGCLLENVGLSFGGCGVILQIARDFDFGGLRFSDVGEWFFDRLRKNC